MIKEKQLNAFSCVEVKINEYGDKVELDLQCRGRN